MYFLNFSQHKRFLCSPERFRAAKIRFTFLNVINNSSFYCATDYKIMHIYSVKNKR